MTPQGDGAPTTIAGPEETGDSAASSAPEELEESVEITFAPARRVAWYRSPPVLIFAAVEMIALFVWLNISRNAWFDLDEWDFLAQRKAGSLHDLFRPHNGHWTTLPILVYRFLFWLIGLRTYFPYRFLIIVLYLTVAALLRVVLRRAGVNPWIATAAASLYSLFGVGYFNIIRGFQITLTGSMVCGLAHLLLADHDGPVDRRDVAGIVVGFVGLLCSGLSVVMVVIVTIVMLLKRGWRVALVHSVPFATAYALWAITAGHRDTSGLQGFGLGTIRGVIRGGFGITLEALAPAGYLAVPLALMLVGGFSLAVWQRRRAGTLTELAAPVAMFVAVPLFLTMSTAFNTRKIPTARVFASQSRYVSIVALFLLPALAVAADAIARRWRVLVPLAVILFVFAIPRNVHYASGQEKINDILYRSTRRMVLTVPRVPAAQNAPRSLEPERVRSWRITLGWLRDGVAQGRIPKTPITPFEQQSAAFRLSFDLADRPLPTTECSKILLPSKFTLEKGDVIGIYDNAISIEPAGPRFPVVVFTPEEGKALVVLGDPGKVTIKFFRSLYFPNPDIFGRVIPTICIEHHGAPAPK